MTERTETEQTDAAGFQEAGESPGGAHTGNARVDRVLDSTTGLEQKPVEEHVEVFERAHEELRGALNEPADTPPAG